MLDQKSSDIEIKSDKARKIINQIPSFIIRMGITSLVSFFLITILMLSLIDIEPQLKVEAVLISQDNRQITGYLLFPYKKTIPISAENQLIVKTDKGNISFQCKADFNHKKKYINNTNIYWQIPLIIEKSPEKSDYTISGQINAYTQIKSTEISVLRWLLNTLFNK